MYKSVIEIKKDVPEEILKVTAVIADAAFDNRGGKLINSSQEPYRLVYQGDERYLGCLELGMLALEKDAAFLSFVSAWNWIDEDDPDENCDILREMMITVR